MKTSLMLAACALLFTAVPVRAETQTFEQALALAYAKNPSLQAQRAKLRAFDETVAEAKSGWRPSVDGVASIGRSEQVIASGGLFAGSGALTPRQAGVVLTQPVFKGFRTVAAVDAAKAQVKAQRAALQAYEQQTLLMAAKAYLDVVEAQNVVALTQHNEDVLQEQLTATQQRFENGEVTKTDVSQAQARLSVALAQRIQAQGELANSRAAYLRVVGMTPETLAQPQILLDVPTTLEEALVIAGKANPEIIAATFAQDAARANIIKAKGNLLPEVDLVASASRGWDQSLMLPKRLDESTIMARVIVPFYRGGGDYARTRAAQEMSVQTGLELEDARAKAREAAVTAWESLQTARAAIKAHRTAVQAMELALKGVRVEADVGERTTLDVLNAEQELLSAKVNLIKAQHDEALAILRVKASLGTLTVAALHLPTDLYDPTAHFDAVADKWFGF